MTLYFIVWEPALSSDENNLDGKSSPDQSSDTDEYEVPTNINSISSRRSYVRIALRDDSALRPKRPAPVKIK